MSDTVDQRVVSMQFDNAAFERGVQQTLNSLNTLNQTVERTGQTNSGSFDKLVGGLTQVEREVHHGVLPAMDAMTNKFSFFGTIADQAIRNITNSMMDFGHKAISSIFQVQGGMNEYELKMGSIQTILSGTGESLDVVKDKLEELNTYSDKTIYSFKDMTDNIGKFTNQGVKLDNAVNAIKGIANEAAVSGANAQQASHAMYNFSQALSSGYIKLIDWKSIENAQMATMEFKQTLLDTATALGTVVKHGDKYITTTTNMQGKTSDLFNAQKGFNDSLQNQWLTSDVLTQALELYATDIRDLTDAEKKEYEAKLKSKGFTDEQIRSFEDLGQKAADAAKDVKTFSMLIDTAMEAIGSGWAQTFEIIFGDFYEAKALWTGINNEILDPMISKFSDVRNNMLKVWKDNGGRTATLQTFVNLLNAIENILTPIGQAFEDVFGHLDGNVLAEVSKNLAVFTFGLISTNGEMDELREKARVVFSVLRSLLSVLIRFKEPLIAIWALTKAFAAFQRITMLGFGLGGLFTTLKMIMLLGIAAKLLLVNKNLTGITYALNNIGNLPIFKFLRTFVFGTLALLLKGIEKIYNIISKSEIFNSIYNKLERIGSILKHIFYTGTVGIKDIKSIGNAFRDLFKDISNWGKNGLKPITDFFTTASKGSVNTAKSIQSVEKPVKKVGGVFDTISAKLGNLFDSFNLVSYAAEKVEKPTYKLVDGTLQLVEGVENTTEAMDSQTGVLDSLIGGMEGFLNKMSDLIPILSPVIDILKAFLELIKNNKDNIKSFGDAIYDAFVNMDFKKVLPFAIIAAYIFFLMKLGKAVQNVGGSINKIFGGGIIENIKAMTTSVSGFFNVLKTQYQRSAFTNISKGILYLASAFAILALTIKNISVLDFAAIIGSLMVLIGLTLGVTVAMAKMSTMIDPRGMVMLAFGLATFGIAVLAVVGSVAILGAALYGLTKVTGDVDSAFNAMMKPLEVLAMYILAASGAMLVFGATLSILGYMAPAMTAGALSLLLIVKVFTLINASLLSLSVTANMVAPLIALLVGQFAAMYIGFNAFIQKFTEFNSLMGVVKLYGKTILIVVGSLIAATVGFMALSAGIGSVSVVIGITSIALLALGLSLMSVGAGLSSIAKAIDEISNTKIPEVGSAIAELYGKFMMFAGIEALLSDVGIAAVFIGLAAALKLIGPPLNSVGGGILKLSVAVIAFAFAVKLWSEIDSQKLLDGVLLMALGIVTLARALKMVDGGTFKGIAAGIASLVVGLYMLTPLIALYAVSWESLIPGMLAIGGLLIVLGKSLSYLKNIDGKDVFLGIAGLLSGLLGITMLIIVLDTMLEKDLPGVIRGVAGLVTIFAGLALALKVMSGIVDQAGDMKKFLVITATMVYAVGILSAVLGALAYLVPYDALLVAALSLSMAVAVFAGATYGIVQAANTLQQGNVLSIIGILLSFAGAVSLSALSMMALKDVPWPVIIAFFVGFGAAIFGVVYALGSFGAQANAAVPIMGIVAAVVLALAAVWWGIAASINAVCNGLAVLLSAIEKFVTFLADFSDRTEDVKKMSKALAELGKDFLPLAGGIAALGGAAIVLGAGLVVASAGLMGFSLAMVATGAGIFIFMGALSAAINLFGETVASALQWGIDLVQNIIDGMLSRIDDVKDAALTIATTIWELLHQSEAEWGPLSDTLSWGADLVGNICTGMLGKLPTLEAVSGAVGETIKSSFTESTAGTGSDMISKILGEMGSKTGLFSSLGATQGSAYVSAFLNKLKGIGGFNTEAVAKGRAKRKGEYANYNFNRDDDSGAGVVNHKDQKNISHMLGDFLSDTVGDATKNLDLSKEFEGLGGDGGAGGGSGSGGSGGSGSGSAKEAEEAAKKAAEAEKQHKKYLDLTTKSALAYDGVYKNLNNTLDDTKPSENAQNAIKALAEDLYKASLTGNETEEELAKMAENTEKVFIEMYENIKKKISDSLDFTKEFDKGFSNIIKPKQLMKNLTSQITGNIDMNKMWKELAMRGTPTTLMKELIEKGSEALPQIRTMLQLTADEYKKYIAVWNKKDSFAEFAANEAVASMALAGQINKIREASKAQKEYVVEGQKIINDWNSIQNDGSLASQAAYDITAKRMEELAKKYGVSVEQIQKACKEVADGTKNSVAVQIEQFDKLDSAYNKWVNGFNEAKDRYLSGMGDFLTSFSEFKTEEDDEDKLTVDKMKENLKDRAEALAQWNSDIQILISNGLNQEKLNELVAAGPESSYQTIHTLAEASKEDIDEINEYLNSAKETISNSAISYGQSTANSIIAGFDATLLPYFESLGTKFNLSDLLTKAGLDLEALGAQLGFGVKSGIESSTTEVQNSTTYMAEGVDNAAGKYINHENGFDKAANFMIGLLDGIEEYKDDLLESIEDVCSAVGEEPYDAWDEGSPSKLTRKYAKWYIQGMVGGFKYYGTSAINAVKDNIVDPVIGNLRNALTTAYDLLVNEDDFQPTITPVLDLSDIESGRRSLASLMATGGMNISANVGKINTPASKMDNFLKSLNSKNVAQNPTGNNFNFVQNNYSPKALSRLEIYRQTKNQFAQMKGLVNK